MVPTLEYVHESRVYIPMYYFHKGGLIINDSKLNIILRLRRGEL